VERVLLAVILPGKRQHTRHTTAPARHIAVINWSNGKTQHGSQSESQKVRKSESQRVRESESQRVRESESQRVRESESQRVRESDRAGTNGQTKPADGATF